jgi:TPR repeat protein
MAGRLAEHLASGTGIQRDEVRARAVYAKACDAQDPDPCYDLAGMLQSGRGGPADAAAARARLAQACKGGVPRACH